MEKRTILAMVLAMIVLMVWFKLFPTKPSETLVQRKEKETVESKKQVQIEKEEIEKEEIKKKEGEEIIVKTDKILVSFSTQGGGINDWSIKEKGKWTSLVLKKETSAPFDYYKDVIFDVDKDGLMLNKTEQKGEINFTCTTPQGLTISKIYKFRNDDYLIELDIKITNSSEEEQRIENFNVRWTAGIGPEDVANRKGRGVRRIRPLLFGNEKLNKKIKIKPQERKEFTGGIKWIGVDNSYFLVALIPRSNIFSTAEVEKEGNIPHVALTTSLILKPAETKEIGLHLYLGPKEYTHLKKIELDLEKTVEFGFFGDIGKLVLFILKFFYKITGNFGWSIVLLTMVLQLILWPLTAKSFKSMQALKKVQPQINALREKYKDDPKRLNVEMMNLYKTRKVNPFGGCLPMILQIPIFWALFTTLRNAVELRHAPFIFWIKDLSTYDPYYVLPILMGIVMFLQQKVTTADPQQAKMVIFMPVIFVVLFLKFPAGLVLYWFVNNILNLIGQLVIIKRNKDRQT